MQPIPLLPPAMSGYGHHHSLHHHHQPQQQLHHHQQPSPSTSLTGGGGGGGVSTESLSPLLARHDRTERGKTGRESMPKKKRKQLVACDSCRLRRVKCDKADMGGGDCSECLKKHINCTDAYVKSKPRVVRSGKLIQQAKKLYGDGQEGSGDESKPSIDGDQDGTEEFDGLLYAASTAAIAVNSSASASSTPLPVVRGPQARLVMTQLGLAIQDHLVQVYFNVFQEQMHVVDWAAFQRTWDSAGRNSEAMSPTNECLAVVIQAWAARLSDHPVVLGQEGAMTLPTLNDVRNQPGRDFTDVGNRREPFARAMLDRALKTVDERGALRKPSAACCYALLLLEFLVVWDNSGSAPSSSGRSMMVNCAEHMRAINESSYVSADPDEHAVPAEQISGGTLLWMLYTRDALAAVIRGRTLCLTDDDLSALSDLLAVTPHANEIMSTVSSDNPQMLLGLAVVSVFRHLTAAIRSAAKRISGALPRRHRLNEAAVRELWSEIDQSARYAAIFQESVSRMDWTSFPTAKAQTWFRDVTVMHAQITLGMHRIISARWELESTDERALTRDPVFTPYLDMVYRLKQQSDERLLASSRDVAKMWRLLGTSIVFDALLSTEYAREYLNHMLLMRTWEEGGPASWTWENKQRETADVINVLRHSGWCWPGYDSVIADANQRLSEEHTRIDLAQRRRQNSGPAPPHGAGNGTAGYPPNGWRSSSGAPTLQHLQAPSYPASNGGAAGTYATGYSPYSNNEAHSPNACLASYGLGASPNPIATSFLPPNGPPPSSKDKLAHLLGKSSVGSSPSTTENGTPPSGAQWR